MNVQTNTNEMKKAENRRVTCTVLVDNDHFDIPINIDNDNKIRFSSKIGVYTAENKSLIEAAVKIKSSELFDKEKVKKAFSSYTQFVPFDYQIENVITMLNDFEGRGCFGDQVGLGKTVEALMTAHAMYECGAIKNVLIVATAQTPKQWQSEIDRKFKIGDEPIFVIGNARDEKGNLITRMSNVVGKIREDNLNNVISDKCRVYIASDYITQKDVSDDGEVHKAFVEYIKQENDGDKKSAFAQLCEKEYEFFRNRVKGPEEFLLLNGFLHPAIEEEGVDKYFEQSGGFEEYYNEDFKKNLTEVYGKKRVLTFYKKKLNFCALEKDICEVLLKFLISKLNVFWDSCVNRYINYVTVNNKDYVRLGNAKAEQIFNSMAEGNEFCTAVFGRSVTDDELVKKLFYKKPEDIEDKRQIGTLLSFRDALNCVSNKLDQMIRTSDEKIESTKIEEGDLDLLIIDEVHNFANNSGKDDIESFNIRSKYIYETPSKYRVFLSATPIRKGLSDAADLACFAQKERFGKDYAEQRDYFYDIICGVDKNAQDHALGAMVAKGETNRLNGIINASFTRSRVSDDIVEKSMARMQRDVNAVTEFIRELKDNKTPAAQKLLNCIRIQYYIGGYMLLKSENIDFMAFCADFSSFLNGIDISDSVKSDMLLQAFDTGAMDFFATNDLALSRGGGDALDAERLYPLVDWSRAKKIIDVRHKCGTDIDSVVKDLAYLINRGKINGRAVIFDASKEEREKYVKPALSGHRVIEPDRERGVGFSQIEHDVQDDNSLKRDIQNKMTEILLPNGGGVVGTNLTEANTLVLASLDSKHNVVAEPLDIEQWIGRIYRTGQKRDCNIIVYPRSNVKEWKNNKDLLQFYLDVLSDKDGLDLFGDGNAEVGFVAPIVVNYLHMVCDKCKSNGGKYYGDEILESARYDGNKIDRPSFAGFVKLVADDKSAVKLYLTAKKLNSDKKNDVNRASFKKVVQRICKMVADNTNVLARKTEGDKNE